MLLSEIRRNKLINLLNELKHCEDTKQREDDNIKKPVDNITEPFSKIIKTLRPQADFEYKNDNDFNF
jgi:hypothetical protein